METKKNEKPVLNMKELIVNGEELQEVIAVEVANRFRDDNHGFNCKQSFAMCCSCDNNKICVLRRYRMAACAAADEAIRHFFQLRQNP